MKNETLTRILSTRIVAILRGADPDSVLSIIDALHAGGISNVEITLNSPNALELIHRARDVMGDRMLVGAGTVLDPEGARAAIDAGARFIISPALDEDTVRYTLGAGVVSIPGALTPTEILRAYRLGADIVKVFPASAGPGYIRDIRAPLSHIPLMPTGGIRPDNVKAYRDAGGVAFGVGSALVDARIPVTEEYLLTIRETARAFITALSDPST
jgi:2-dehydro-3-deoxyphosphogluconate aldolase/(4S)-4-hydroxy-2-oxoglutarate aldolase